MSGSYGVPDIYSAAQDVYSEAPNAYSEAAESVYDAIRNAWPPTPPLNSRRNTNSTISYTPLLDPNIVRPNLFHAQDFRASTVSPPLNPPSWPALGYGGTGAPPTISQQTIDGGKLSVSIDFGESSAPDSPPKR